MVEAAVLLRRVTPLLFLACAPALPLAAQQTAPLTKSAAAPAPSSASGPFRELRFRAIGPAVTGGRIHDVEALPGDPSTLYVASATGGLWKSTNHGTTWTPIFDGQPTGTFGVVAIAPSNPQVVWAGTGEQNNRQSTSWGDGVFRSSDGGQTWTHVGLEATRAIGRIVVDPQNPDVAYVAALGNLWKPSAERGVFRTRDGGRTWTHVLAIDTLAGVVDLAMDPHDPRTLYAAAYQRLRTPFGFNGGGPGGGIYKTTDAGDHWTKLSGGLPTGDVGRIGLAVARNTPGLLYAIVESASAPGIYRSADGGATWTHQNALDDRPAYYSTLYVDPRDDDRLYSLARWFYRSDDAGKTWRRMPTEPTYDVGLKGDYHAMWIDPANTKHFYLAGDGGLYQSWDRGETYTRLANLPIAQLYGLGLDDRGPANPYYIYPGFQDDHSWEVPSATRHYLGITDGDWREIGFNDGLQGQVDLAGPRYVYSNAVEGDLTLVNAFTGDRRTIRPRPAPGQPRYRFEWMSPGKVSSHTPGTYYYGAQSLLITHDRGESWEATQDLTRGGDRDTMRIMGVPDRDVKLSRNDGQTAFPALSAIDESPLDAQVLWAGSDDGNVQVSRDGGKTWTEVGHNIKGAPAGSYIARIAASRAAPGAAYVAVDNHRRGDFAPYAFRTADFGRTWTSITGGLPKDGSVRFVGEYPGKPGVVFLGTEHALWLSTDSGSHWQSAGADLPTTIYMDVQVQPRTGDVVVATHGRGIFILDDGAILGDWTPAAAAQQAHLFPIRPASIFQYWEDFSYRGQDWFTGENPPDGAILDYSLAKSAPKVALTITNAAGQVVRTLDGPGDAGVVHRVVWDLRHEPPPAAGQSASPGPGKLPTLPARLLAPGPWVSPGTYTVTLQAGDARATGTVEVRPDPGMPQLTLAQYRAREAFLVKLLALQRQAFARAQQPGASPGARRLLMRASTLASQFNGRGAVQGSLYPPTPAQRAELAALEAGLAGATATR